MKAIVYCKLVGQGTQAYFVKVNGKSYYLFKSKYRVSNRDMFRNGVRVDKINDFSSTHSTSVKKTKDKLAAYLSFIEKEYGVVIYSNRARKHELGKRCRYNRSKVMNSKVIEDDDYALSADEEDSFPADGESAFPEGEEDGFPADGENGFPAGEENSFPAGEVNSFPAGGNPEGEDLS
ncbi:MAG: hypothetical protein LUD51_03340 [Clostridia bacterium]|nr:hypothetical protein [Clostridia bacterium]